MEKIIVVAAAGAVNKPPHHDVLPAICAIIDFKFQAHSILLFEENLHSIQEALNEFHDLKNAIIIAGGRTGRKGLIGHFNISKLEAMQWLILSTHLMGAPFQQTSDVTKQCHCTHCKRPYQASSKKNYYEQSCYESLIY